MLYEIRSILRFNEDIVGYIVSLGGNYACSVSKEKAVELGVQDISLACYMDFLEVDVVPIGRVSYGVVANSSGFFEELSSEPFDYFGDRKVYYGYYFEDRFILKLDDELALQRMISEAKGVYTDE